MRITAPAGSGRPTAHGRAHLSVGQGGRGNRPVAGEAASAAAHRDFDMDSATAGHGAHPDLPSLVAHLLLRIFGAPGQRREAERWWSISGRPIIDELGQFRGFIGSGSDLTAKRRCAKRRSPASLCSTPDRPRQPPAHAAVARSDAGPAEAAPTGRPRCSCSISTASRRSTTRSATRSATSCSSRSRQRLQRSDRRCRAGRPARRRRVQGRAAGRARPRAISAKLRQGGDRLPVAALCDRRHRRSRSAARSASRVAPDDGDDSGDADPQCRSRALRGQG